MFLHVQRINDNWLPKKINQSIFNQSIFIYSVIFYSELSSCVRNNDGQSKRYKDTLKQTLKLTGINAEIWHELAEGRTAWRKAVKKGVRSFEDDRAREDKRLKRKANEALDTIVQEILSATFVCQTCGRACKSRIGLYSHSRTHPQQHWHHRNRRVHHHQFNDINQSDLWIIYIMRTNNNPSSAE